jgi:hypothetical protein
MSDDDMTLDHLAGQLLDDEDATLLTELARLYERIDPVPEGLVERIAFTLALADLEVELAQLTEEYGELVGARGEEQARTVTFCSESLTVMVTITPAERDVFRLDGWIAPPGAFQVELRSDRATRQTEADADGRFDFTDVGNGLVQLVFQSTEHSGTQLRAPVVTPAVQL